MKKFFSALALVAMILFPLALQAKTVTFTINIPEAAYIQETRNYTTFQFNGKESVEVTVPEQTGVQVRPNAGYDLVTVTVGDKTLTPYYGNVYVDLDDVADGSTIAILAEEKQPRVFTVYGDPDQVSLSVSGTIYGKEDNVDGKWTFSDNSDYGCYMDINCISGYVVESMINKANDQQVLSDYNLFKQTASYYLSASEFPKGAEFTLSCTTLAAVRTVHVSLEVVDGEDSEVAVRRNGEYETIPSSEWGDIALNPNSELPLSISATDYNKAIYKVEVNGENITPEYGGSFSLNNLKNGDKIKVWPNYPDVNVPVKFVFTNEGTTGAVQSVYVNNNPVNDAVWQAEDFTVKLGESLGVSFNTAGYQINSAQLNGQTISTYSYSNRVTSETPLTFVIDAEKLSDYTVKLYYEPGSILVYNSYGTDNPIELPADANEATLTIARGSNYLNIKPANGYIITSAINLQTESTVYLPVSITGDMEIAIYTEKFDRDNKCVVYLAPNDQSWNYAQVTLSQSNYELRKDIALTVGYNFIEYATVDIPFYLGFYPSADVYLNGVICENEYGAYPAMKDMEPNSVIKIFPQGTEVPTYALTIDNQSDGGVEILADYITPVEGTEAHVFGPTDVEFVTVSAAAAEGQTAYIVKVNGEEVKADAEGKVVAHIEADSTISVEVDNTDSITEITAEGESPVYNLQGIRVQNPRSGIFIQNGRKIKF